MYLFFNKTGSPLILFSLLLSIMINISSTQAASVIYKDSYPGMTVKVVEVQGPNITELGGSIPAYHDLRFKADAGDVFINNISYTNLKNMDSERMGKQQVEGLHLERAKNKSFYKTLTPINSYEKFRWSCDLSYTFKGREYTQVFEVVSSDVIKERPRFRKNDGTDELAASLGLGIESDSEFSDSVDMFGDLESELNLTSSKYDSSGRFTSGMDILLVDVEPYVERMRMIRSHNALLDKESDRLLVRAETMDKAIRQTAEMHKAQDEQARRRAQEIARREKEKNNRSGTLTIGILSTIAAGASGLSTSDALEVGTRMMRKYDSDNGGGNSDLISALEATNYSFKSIEESNRQSAELQARLRNDMKRQQERHPGVEMYEKSVKRSREFRDGTRTKASQHGNNTSKPSTKPNIPTASFTSNTKPQTKKRSRYDINWCCFSLSCGASQEARDWESKGIKPGPAKYPNNQACNGNVWSKSSGRR